MKTAFRSIGLVVGDARIPDITLEPGACGGWHVRDADFALEVLDGITGLQPVQGGESSWFGQELSGLPESGILRLLSRTMTLTADGPLIANLNVRDNVLLPALHRRTDSEAGLLDKLELLLTGPDLPWPAPANFPLLLPHHLEALQRWLAGLLRAALAVPEIVLCCHYPGDLSMREQAELIRGFHWLRGRLPGAAWLFLSCEPVLPGGFSGSLAEVSP
ncbi:MAG: hypothetical protein WCS31_12050 [Verrucomicrobiae bacterium]